MKSDARRVKPGNKFARRGQVRYTLAWILIGAISGVHADSIILPVPSANWVSSGSSTYLTPYLDPKTTASTLSVSQLTPNIIYNWDSFNVGPGGTVAFQYTDPSGNVINAPFQALNRIWDANPSLIQGAINAPGGTIYLINSNGIIFGAGAQVSVGSLVASSLNITDELFTNGLLSNVDGLTPMFEGTTGFVKVLEGASIITEKNGLVMMLAPTVLNAGTITTPEGQTILGAGTKIWLAASTDVNLRGLVIEVDNPGVTTYNQANTTIPAEYSNPEYDMLGMATNLGQIITERGNTTMIGYAVNQMGRISATTSVSLNGSIHLLAQTGTDDVPTSDIALYPTLRKPLEAGRVVLGAGSITEILPEDSSETSIDSQLFLPSTVKIVGKEIIMQSGAGILAPAGVVNITAVANPSSIAAAAVDGVRVQFDPGSWIDVAGLTDVTASVSSNILEVELRGDELKDSPLQQDGILYGQTVYVDVNVGTPVADISGYEANIGRTARERSTVGGTVNVKSEGDIVFQTGASINVSGGQTTYTPGYVQTTQLISNGQLVDIANASPDVIYEGFADRIIIKDEKWGINETIFIGETLRYDPGYIKGGNAGSVIFDAPVMVLNGGLTATTVASTYPGAAVAAPLGGYLQVGRTSTATTPDYILNQDVLFDYTQPQLADGFQLGDTLAQNFQDTVVLNPAWFNQGFNRVAVYTNKGVSIVQDSPVNLAAGGSFTVRASSVDIGGNITVPAGIIDIETKATTGNTADLDITVADGVQLSVAGQWVNDFLVPGQVSNNVLLDGGAIILAAAQDLTLGSGSLLDANGGAKVANDGSVTGGDGGDITLKAGTADDANLPTATSTLSLGGELRSYSLNKGGKLTLSTPGVVQIGGLSPVETGLLYLDTGFFSRGGFSSFDVNGARGLTVAEGANIDVRMSTLQLNPDYVLAGSGSNILDYSSVVLQPDAQREGADIKLSANSAFFGELTIGEGARIGVDPGAKIELSAGNQLTVYGELSAPGGEIVLTTSNSNNDIYDNSRSIWIASTARLLTGGVAQTTTNSLGLITGEVLDGGSITIDAKYSFLVVEEGALLDVSGTSAYLDIPTEGGGIGQVVASNAGSINLSASEALFFNGTVKADAGGSQAWGGTFSATLDGKRWNVGTDATASFLQNERVLTLSETAGVLPAGLTPGGALAAGDNGTGAINVQALVDAGVEQMTFKSSGSLVVDNLTVADSANLRWIMLDAPKIEARGVVDLSASYILAGSIDSHYQSAQTASSGTAEMWLRGDFVDLIGSFAVNGVSDLHIESQSDIRFLGVVPEGANYEDSTRLTGLMSVAGNVEFKAAQLYPGTRTTFEVNVVEASGGTITVAPYDVNAALPAAPLTADGELIIRAPNIVQGGVIRAPFGVIDLEASGSLTVAPGSLTSVAALGPDGTPLLIPYGVTENELSWVYEINGNVYEVGVVPEKSIRLSGQILSVDAGATVDISAGGDLQAYEFFAGNGGSLDVLAQEGVFAILPGYSSQFAPWDVMQNTADIKPGDAVYLSGAPGLAAGTYTLLPAHYALLPGAYAVQVADNSAGLLPGFGSTQPDGSLIVPGYLTDSRGTARGAWSGFEVISNAIVQTQSEFAINTASNFFPNVLGLTQGLAQDAGRLSLVGQQALTFAGDLIAAAIPGYRGAQLDISSDFLAIADASAVLPAGYVTIDPTLLASLPVESFLFGGTRRTEDGNVLIEDVATDVIVDTAGYGNVLAARELMFTATNSVTVRDGSQLAASGDVRNDAIVNYSVTGDGALLRLGADVATLTRSGTAGLTGDLIVEAGAELSTSYAAIFDATRNNNVYGALAFEDGAGNPVIGGSLTLGASRIGFTGTGASAPLGTPGLVFDQTQLDNFSALDLLNFTSYSGFDFYGNPVLGALDANGTPLTDTLTLQGGALNSYVGAGGIATIQAASFVYQNPGAAVDTSAPASAGELQINATQAIFGAGDKAIRGFETVTVSADEIVARGVLASGSGVTNTTSVSGNVVLNAGRITGETGASQTLSASGVLTTLQNLLANALAPATQLGASWTLEGSSVTHGGTVEMPSGNLTLHATTGDVVVEGQINAAGIVLPFFDVNVHAPGGTVTLTSDNGKVKILDGALVNVSGTAEADAGTLSVNAVNSVAEIASGSILGNSTGAASGRFELDVGTLADFSALNSALNAGGFHEARTLRVRTGDVSIAATETGDNAVLAQNFQLTADTGNITVAGEVNASGDKGGFIGFYAKNNLTLESGARLDASASAAGEQGGDIELFSTTGFIDLKTGSTVAASGGEDGLGGTLHLRALRNSSNNDVQVTALGSTFTGLDQILLEAYKVYTDSSITTSDTSTTSQNYTEASSFMANTAAIETRLGVTGNTQFQLAPGIEIQSTGNLALTNDWGLHTWRYDPVTGALNTTSTTGLNASGQVLTAGVLTLRAAGDLNLNATLSDGFSSTSVTSTSSVLQGYESWSYRLVAGADLASPDLKAVNTDGAGNVVLASGKVVRTGSGDIEIAAGGNLDMSAAVSSVIYTAGRAVTLPASDVFTKPTNYTASDFGGDIKIEVGGDVLGYAGDSTDLQLVNEWLYRQGSLLADGSYDKQPAWWVRFDKFKQGIGALGGGDISIDAGGDLLNVSAVIPTNAWTETKVADIDNVKVHGGGDLIVRAGGDILAGIYYVAQGVGELYAGGSIGANPDSAYPELRTLLALGDGQFHVSAAQDLGLESVFNPQVVTQDSGNAFGSTSTSRSAFFTYSPESALAATSLTGDVTLYNDTSAIGSAFLQLGTNQLEPGSTVLYPGTVFAQALSGDVIVKNSMIMYPSPVGQLSLIAANNVVLTGATINMTDIDPQFASVLQPAKVPSDLLLTYGSDTYTGLAYHATTPVHQYDTEPVRIYALSGNIEGSTGQAEKLILPKSAIIQAGGDIVNLNLVAQNLRDTDVSRIEAGGDIVYDTPRSSNNQLTVNQAGIQLGGPGSLELIAGGDLDLGTSLGILTRGNLMNPSLPSGGADVMVMVGLAAFDAALDKLRLDIGAELAATGTLSQTLLDEARLISGNPDLQPQDALVALSGATALSGAIDRLYLQIDQSIASGAFTDALASSNALSVTANDLLIQARLLTGIDDLQPSAVLGQLSGIKTLPLAQQESMVRDMVFEGARTAGRRATDSASEYFGNYDLGYKTIELAFPCIDCKDAAGEQKYYDGDINGFFSQVRTEQGGGMDFLVPGGRWVVGLANVPEELIGLKSDVRNPDASAAASKLGVVSMGEGDIRAVVYDDILVNQSRILTLTGSGMLLWSSQADIDAGKGKKTITSVPPPVTKVNPDGSISIEVQGAATGSGIGVLQTIAGAPVEDAELYAPNGAINAGDAGIRAAGNLRLGALTVIGSDNISVGGVSVGVSAGESSSLAAGFAGTSGLGDAANATDSITKSLSNQDADEELKRMKQALAQFRPSFITVEVVGFGE